MINSHQALGLPPSSRNSQHPWHRLLIRMVVINLPTQTVSRGTLQTKDFPFLLLLVFFLPLLQHVIVASCPSWRGRGQIVFLMFQDQSSSSRSSGWGKDAAREPWQLMKPRLPPQAKITVREWEGFKLFFDNVVKKVQENLESSPAPALLSLLETVSCVIC